MFPLLDVTEKYLGFYLSGVQGWICSDGPGYSFFFFFFWTVIPRWDEEVMPAKAVTGGY